ncbi:MAG: NUDIX domain-containing protein [Aigarchaeota archaeon]|nr:NUDIX domain-containing protein [Candidatus Pelearchaeum maunauluense]
MGKRKPELTVGAFIIRRDGKMLLVKSPKWGGRYSIPGGHVEYGETIAKAVAREAYEEVSLRVKPLSLFMIQEVINPSEFFERDRHFIFFDVLCAALSDNVQVDGKEIVDYVWVYPREASKLPLERYTRRLVSEYIRICRKTAKRNRPAATILALKRFPQNFTPKLEFDVCLNSRMRSRSFKRNATSRIRQSHKAQNSLP